MVLLFLSAGILIGATSAGVVFWVYGSLLLALLAYSCLGVLGALAAVLIVGLADRNTPSGPGWSGLAQPGRPGLATTCRQAINP